MNLTPAEQEQAKRLREEIAELEHSLLLLQIKAYIRGLR